MWAALDVATAVQAVLALLGIAALVGAIVGGMLHSSKNELIKDLTAMNTLLRQERDDERVRCAATTARLEGERDALKGRFAADLAAAVLDAAEKRREERGDA